jgi:tRNA threonylcarbamoyladenosine modification (KEOPS) complex Cgi121 subunit
MGMSHLPAPPRPHRTFLSPQSALTNGEMQTQLTDILYSIKKPKTHRYPSLKGTDPKFRRNHKHALHGTMKALKEVKEGKRDAA